MKLRSALSLLTLLLALAPYALLHSAAQKREQSATNPVLYLIGDSTVNTPTRGQLGWGTPLPEFFDLNKISLENRARGGRSSRTYLDEGLWQEVCDKLKSGDYVLMQFGHNDGGPINDNFRARGSIKGIGEESEEIDNLLTKKHEIVHSYGWYLRRYINDAKAKGAIPIVLSPIPRNNWKNGKIARANLDYGKWAKEVAQQTGVQFIDLNEIIARHYETLSPEKVKADYFTDADNTHTSPAGAVRNAAAVVEGIRSLSINALAGFLLARPVAESITVARAAMQRRVDALPDSLVNLQRQFLTPPDEARIMMRWWWFGPAVTKEGLEREMRMMKAGGIGGFEIQPVYPVELDDAARGIKTMPFLSDEFVDVLRFTNNKARELGLRVDLTVGSGWPYGGPTVGINQAAGRLRVDRVRINNRKRIPLPHIGAGEKLLAIFLARVTDKAIAPDSLKEITAWKDDELWLAENNAAHNEVMFFIASRTGMMVKRPAIGSEGYVLDHYDRTAIDDYLKNVGDRLLQAFDGQPPTTIFCDSLEVFSSDWTGDFLTEFQRRRGYDLKPHLPALVADLGPQTAAIRNDWGQTLTELLNERFMMPMRDWAKRHQTKFRIQGYGIPPATIGSNAYVDLTDGEGSHWKVLRAARWASSANHIFGRNVTASETWTWLHSPSFRATPLDVKAEADLHFLQGINQLIGHGWPYTPESAEYPGGRFYAAGVFNDKNPWWIVMPDLALYLQRVSYLLRQGQPVNDVAFYLPNHDAWAGFVSPKVHYMIEALRDRIGDDVIARTLEAGFNLDFVDDDVLQKMGRSDNGLLTIGANKYKAVILPNVERIPLATLQLLDEFARKGGKVIATKRLPALAPGLQATAADHQQVKELASRLFDDAHFVADENRQLDSQLSALLRPDVSLSSAKSELGFLHRQTPEADIYFLVNTSNQAKQLNATFRISSRNAEWWNPHSGEVAAATIGNKTNESMTVAVELKPYESRFLVFTKRSLPAKTEPLTAAPLPAVDLSDNWRVSFGSNSRAMNQLQSWTEAEATRFYSGVATYERSFTMDERALQNGREVWLDFGEGTALREETLRNGMRAWLDGPVREAAVVYLNGQRAGSVWCPPYRVEVSKLLRAGNNELRIVVGNTAINHLAGQSMPDYRLLNLRFGERFKPQDMDNLQPLPSGLLGTVRLIAK